MSYTSVVAIDPAMDKSGICVYNIKQNKITKLDSLRIWELFKSIENTSKSEVFWLVENSNLLKGNWHGKTARGNVGKNKGVSQNIVDFLRAYNYNFEELFPKGYSLRYKDEQEFIKETGCEIKSNKDNRSAAAMIYANKHLIKTLK